MSIKQKEVQTTENNQQLNLAKRFDDLMLIKNIIAKDNPFIIKLDLSQDEAIPEVSEGIK